MGGGLALWFFFFLFKECELLSEAGSTVRAEGEYIYTFWLAAPYKLLGLFRPRHVVLSVILMGVSSGASGDQPALKSHYFSVTRALGMDAFTHVHRH